ncbi:ABC transporter ATP-binding protein [bacterium]|nr:ABC transporter ATP-binding protein [bacterium]
MSEGERPPILETQNLRMWFPVTKGIFRRTIGHVRAVDDVSLQIREGETLGLVGESGCGKSTLVQTLLRILAPTDGKVIARFNGSEVLYSHATRRELKPYRRFIQMVFQDPTSSMNPLLTIRDIVGEPLKLQGGMTKEEIDKRVEELIEAVGLRASYANRYPHAFSGGQRQRIGIARAIALNPKLLILDEPVSALDVSVQSQILNLLKDLKSKWGLTYLFIAHNLDVVRYMSDRIAVMYLGRIVEEGPRDHVYSNPKHPYTEMLLKSIPVATPAQRTDPQKKETLFSDPARSDSGCDFRQRCPYATKECEARVPDLREIAMGRKAACFHAEELNLAGRGGQS